MPSREFFCGSREFAGNFANVDDRLMEGNRLTGSQNASLKPPSGLQAMSMQVVLSGNPFCCSAHEYGSALASPVTVRLAGALPSAIAATMRGATKASGANRRTWRSQSNSRSAISARLATRPSLRVCFKTCSRVTKLSQHEADGGKFQEREGVAVEIFPILGETATTIEPCDGSFDDPTLG